MLAASVEPHVPLLRQVLDVGPVDPHAIAPHNLTRTIMWIPYHTGEVGVLHVGPLGLMVVDIQLNGYEYFMLVHMSQMKEMQTYKLLDIWTHTIHP